MNLITVCAIAAAVGFVLGAILYKIFIPLLRKVKLGQKILEIGPSWHKSKEGTPNLGGVIFIIACLVAFGVGLLFVENLGNAIQIALVLGLALSQGLIGFVDDYVKLFKKRNKGLSASQKMVLQFITAAGYLALRAYHGADTIIEFPWGASVDFGVFYYVIMLLVIVYIINCANLTDGIDGLAGSIALIITVMFFLFGINHEFLEFSLTSSALFGALLSFLVFNFYPAKIFMGDTGSLFLGGFIVALTMLTGNEFLLLLVGIIWIIEGLSVVLQVLSFKLTGKRIFKMSPIHHHFEKCGWSEVKIVAVFSLITVIFSTLAYYLLII
ncbi:MAG: phospho-N-acetylmuramoyl-pentapeptide-transferase [Clostridia bacterium]|nr:phospho-N-acetylmuramoyl-pentapeptide-transferase [Clostridia bacterium]